MANNKYDPLLLALKAKTGFQALDVSETPVRLRLFGRVPSGTSNKNTLNWLIVVFRLLKAANQVYKADISKQYFLRNDKVVFGWRVVFEGEKLESYYEFITNIIKESPQTATFEMEEQIIPGARDRNNTAGGKRGAQSALNPVVGPMAAAQKMRGG